MPDPTTVASPHSGAFTDGGITVDDQIYRLKDTKWSLEVVENEGTSTVWDELFTNAEAAMVECLRAVAEEGLGRI